MAKSKSKTQQGASGSTENSPSPLAQPASSFQLKTNRTRQRDSPFISMGIRFRVNVEALNMVETAGNLTKHRVVPIVIYKGGNYSLKWYPALSGETLAHAIQANLALLEKRENKENAKLCYFCSLPEPEFIKHTFLDFLDKLKQQNVIPDLPEWEKNLIDGKFYDEDKDKTIEEKVEKTIVENCVVEDIGGFLITKSSDKIQLSIGMLRRTSAFQVSYAIPTEDSLEEASTTDIQMQVRMAPTALLYATKTNDENSKMLQTPFNKEIASTTYSFVFNFDADKVGISALTNSPLLNNDERIRRAKLLLDALRLVLDGQYGASKSRYYPFISREFILAAVSRGDVLFTVSSPAMKLEDFIEETVARAVTYVKEFGIKIKLYVWINSFFNRKKNIDRYIENIVNKYIPQTTKPDQAQPNSTPSSQQSSGNAEEMKLRVLADNVKIGEGTLSITMIVSSSHAHLIEKLKKEEIEGKQDQTQQQKQGGQQ